MSKDLGEIRINVKIADKNYKLHVDSKDEEIVRKAANDISLKTKELSELLEAVDKVDYVAMAALSIIVDNYKKLGKISEQQTVIKDIGSLTDGLAEEISSLENSLR